MITMDGDLVLLRLSEDVWVSPRQITAAVWEEQIAGDKKTKMLCIYHPAASADYFVVDPDFQDRVARVLGVARS